MNIKSVLNRIFFVFLALLLTVFGIVRSTLYVGAKADGSTVLEFEQTSVLDNLENSLINGEKFSLKDYNFDTKKDTQVLSFLEYSYSFYESLQGNFGLYVYVYNPQGLKFVANSSLHSISFKIGEDKSEPYSKYPLSVLNFSQDDYYGLFYKLKVVLTEEEKQDILSKLNSTERVYSVSEIELIEEGQTNATSVPAEGIYKFSGYMSGFGSNSSAKNTLKCMTEQMETLSLKPHTTTYRPEGTNGKNDYTQDSLHSVYFAVPNSFIEKYGEMTAVHATWLNAVLAPALVTGNQAAYTAITNVLGVENASLNYAYIGNYEKGLGQSGQVVTNKGDIAYLPDDFWLADLEQYEKEISTLYMLFNSGIGEDSADNYTVQGEDIYAKLKDSAIKYGGNLVNGKYAACVFDSVDSEFTEVNIYRDNEYSLTSEVLGASWWDKLWGNTYVSTFDGIKAIYAVSDADFTGNIEKDCNNLYIGSQDYTNFKLYYESCKTNSTVYLFRYQVSDYDAQEATLFGTTTLWGSTMWEEKDTNAYFFQETVNLDFDIINVTFSAGEKETIIPVVMSPIEHISGGTPPVYTKSDSDWLAEVLTWIVTMILCALLVMGLVIVCPGIISLIVKGIAVAFKWAVKIFLFIICFPFNLIGNLRKKRK